MDALNVLRRQARGIRDRRDRARAFAAGNPGFVEALREDVPLMLAMRGSEERIESRLDLAIHALRFAATNDGFLALAIYRSRAAMLKRGVPVLPSVARRLSIMTAGVCIGDPVVIKPGVYIPHGHVVIDGITTIESGARIRPWVTIGLKEGNFQGPTIGANVAIGTGAKIIGPVTVGDSARIGANAVVVDDVERGTTVVGIPARKASGGPDERD